MERVKIKKVSLSIVGTIIALCYFDYYVETSMLDLPYKVTL